MTTRVAVLQSASSPDPSTNLERLRRHAHAAAAGGTRLLITPEMYLSGYNIGLGRVRAAAADDLLGAAQEVAVDAGIALLVGLPVTADDGTVRNAAAYVDAAGEVRAVHHKTVLFGDLDRELFSPGAGPVTMVEDLGMRISVHICYEIEFPEVAREAALRGAQLLAVPTAQMDPFAVVATHLIPVRAWENQVYVAYANQVGAEGEISYVGLSSIAGPDGQVIAQAGPDDETIIYADVDPAHVAAQQRANPYLEDCRPLREGGIA